MQLNKIYLKIKKNFIFYPNIILIIYFIKINILILIKRFIKLDNSLFDFNTDRFCFISLFIWII